MQDQIYFLNQNLALLLIIAASLLFAVIGILYSRKHQGLSNYLTAGRNVGTTSLTTSLVASALGAWILFGPASAATWGGIGAVIGYSLGTAFPMIAFIFLGRIRKKYPPFDKDHRNSPRSNPGKVDTTTPGASLEPCGERSPKRQSKTPISTPPLAAICAGKQTAECFPF